MWVLTGNYLSSHDPFFLCLVSEHCTAHNVANGKNMWNSGSHLIVDFDAAAVVGSESCSFEVQSVGIGLTAHGNEAIIGRPTDFFPFFIVGLYGDVFARSLHVFDPVLQMEFDPELFHAPHQLFAHASVHGWDNGILVFHHMDFRSQSGVNASHFQSNDTATDDDHAFGQGFKGQRFGGCNDPLFVNFNEGQRCGFGTGRKDDV